jgi:hypothetical protein
MLLAMSARKPAVKEPPAFYPCEYETFMWAVMMAESGGNPRAVYMESWGEESLGLYQLSVSDSKRYADCPSSRDALFDPILNTKCKDSVIKKLRYLHPDENWSQVGGRYWSVLRHPTYWPKARTLPYLNFKKYAASKGCII